jgi:hypothetical protein
MPKSLVKTTWQELREIPSSSATSLMVNLRSALTNHALLLSFIISTQLRMSKILITFYRCVLIFNMMKLLKNLSMAHGLVLKRQFYHKFWFPFSSVLCKIQYMHSSIILDIKNMMLTQTLLFTCDDFVRLNGCREVLLTHPDMFRKVLPQCDVKYYRNELSSYTSWSGLICGSENTVPNILNYSTRQKWVVSFMSWLSQYRPDRKLSGPQIWSGHLKMRKISCPCQGSNSWFLICPAHSVFIAQTNHSGVKYRRGAGICPTT